ncbi:SGNH/GDSL hydrolase family protein [Parablautia muri]|uniref:SGNH hydrolase-type esterase domain-containing protein n=1 Tax=Parablautia muri TaxID=2320879 RepID=A0A9X5BDH5_9FIRM|nr:SGNH/GDSL hydrolase family protein [Parablautia muri]NBJ91758.1 hypothetical protein [Parablautia muri]
MMEKVNKFLLMVITMVVIMITAVGIDKGTQFYNSRKWEKERIERYRQSYADAADMQMTISQLSEDPAAIEAFIEENRAYFDEVLDVDLYEAGLFDGEVQEAASFNEMQENLPGNETENETGDAAADVWGSGMEGGLENGHGSVSDNEIGDVSENALQDVSDNALQDVSANMAGEVSGNEAGVSANRIARLGWSTVSGNSLLEKRKIRGSYIETQMQKNIDEEIIENNEIDFSDISIACLGDSITEASNLDSMEDYQQYAYPTKLKEILDAESITNLGIGGSSIGRYWDKAFVDRYREIPKDTDLIIVMGGTNDGFCLSQEEFGTMEERAENTFIGDLDELMRGLKEDYPEATIVFSTPLPNVLHDVLRKERDYLLPQVVIVNAIKKLAQEHEIPVIDLYNSNILDTHDAAVIYNYMPDGVHCNPAGYSLLAEHFAAELIKLYEDETAMEEDADESIDENENTDESTGENENTDESIDENENTDEGIDGNENTDESVDENENTDEGIDGDENTDESIDENENTDESIDENENTDEGIDENTDEDSGDYEDDPQPHKNG